jgi:NADH:ubiquinone oxidoreductase subunit 3 (subunit A)
MLNDYVTFMHYFFICIFLVVFLFSISFFFVFQKPDSEKNSAYECGFNPFLDAMGGNFDVRFYIVGLLFLIFDLELIFLFP